MRSIKDMLYKKRMERELMRAKGLLKEAEKPPGEEVGCVLYSLWLLGTAVSLIKRHTLFAAAACTYSVASISLRAHTRNRTHRTGHRGLRPPYLPQAANLAAMSRRRCVTEGLANAWTTVAEKGACGCFFFPRCCSF